MIRDEVPLRAVGILDAISRATCTAATVQTLEQLLRADINQGSALRQQSTNSRHPQTLKASSKAAKPQGKKARKQPPVAVLEDREDGIALQSPREKSKLATEVVNTSLKVLTAAIQSQARKPKKLAQRPSRFEVNRPSPSVQTADIQSPLQALSLNCITNASDEKCRTRRSSSARLVTNEVDLMATAECGSLGLAILASVEDRNLSEIQVSPLQLEYGISAFVSKLIALGFHDMAIRELGVLRSRLDKSEPPSGQRNEDPSTARSHASKTQSGPIDEALPNMLMFRNTNANGPLLDLMVTTQFQILRIIAAKPSSRGMEVALKYLNLSGPWSPVALIERQVDHSSPQSSGKAAQQLESLSRLLAQLCSAAGPSERRTHSGPGKTITPSVVFQYRILALEIRLRRWKIARHKGDAVHEVLRPLERDLDNFRRRSAFSEEEKYSYCKAPIERIIARLSDLESEAELSIDSVQQALCRLKLIQADLAYECSEFEKSSQWLKQSHHHLMLSNASKSQICLFTCKRAILSVRSHVKSQGRQQMLDDMKDLSVTLSQDLESDHEGIMEIVVALNAFRKSVLELIRIYQRKPTCAGQPVLDIIVQCAKTMSSGAMFLSKLHTRSERQDNGGGSATTHASGRRLVLEVAALFIDPIAILAKLSMTSTADDWNTVDAGLQCCILLARESQQIFSMELPEEQVYDVKRSGFVAISNAYWCRFLHFKQNSSDCLELRKLLTASVDAMKDQPISVQQSALLLPKLEKLASLYEVLRDYDEAAAAHANIIEFLTAIGSVSAAAEAANRKSLRVVFDKNGAFSLLGRSLISYQNAVSMSSEETRARLPLDLQGLSASEKGMILEYQLKATCSTISSSELAANLLATYTDVSFPIRRLRVINRLALCRSPTSCVNLWEGEQPKQDSDITDQDRGLQQYRAQLQASRDTQDALCSDILDPRRIHNALSLWSGMFQECHDWPTLEAYVDDIPDWLIHLETLVQFFELKGLEYERVSVLNLLMRVHEMASDLQLMPLISTLSLLGSQYVRLGYPSQAGLVLQRAHKYMSKATTSPTTEICWHLAYAEYFVRIGNSEKSDSHLIMARNVVHGLGSRRLTGHQCIQYVAAAASISARISSERGEFSDALFYCRLRVKLLHGLWSKSENSASNPSGNKASVSDEIEKLTDSLSSVSFLRPSLPTAPPAKSQECSVSRIGSLAPQLFDALTSLAEVYAHQGRLSDTRYYLEQSVKVSKNAGPSFEGRYHAQLGQYLLRSGDIENGKSHLSQARAMCTTTEPVHHFMALQTALAESHAKSNESQLAMSTLALAKSKLETMMRTDFTDRIFCGESDRMMKRVRNPSLAEKSSPVKGQITGITKTAAKRKAAITSQAHQAASAKSQPDDCIALVRLKAILLRHQASIAMGDEDFDRVEQLVYDAAQYDLTPLSRIGNTMLTATVAARRALADMATDLVFCVIPESTMCCPAIKFASRIGDDSSDAYATKTGDLSVVPRSRQNRAATKITKVSKKPVLPNFVEFLKKAREDLNKIRTLTVIAGSTADLHNLVDGLIGALMMLSAFPSAGAANLQSPTFAMYVMELGRTIAISRQNEALRIERQISILPIAAEWPTKDLAGSAPLGDIGSTDFASFQSDFLDVVPKSWTVLSLGLSVSHDELRISKYRFGHEPFILNLPLARHSQEDEEGNFDFECGKTELLDIIDLANYSTHDVPDTSRKGARTAWWDTRDALDARLKNLLINIENIWFGGFRGIFGHNPGSPELLSRFQQSLHMILDKYLPSRHKQTKNKKQHRDMLDSHVLELFVALGNPDDKELEETLIDLLYFVIDILQFHGERNAYDEVDFDAITIEVLDALRQYHEAAKHQEHTVSDQHTILILDKSLHCFPWESMPCLRGQAVTRLPSLGCLRDRILQETRGQQSHAIPSASPMPSIDRRNGSYIINPSSDLTATQSRFEASLEKLSDWNGIVRREPSEEEFKTALERKDIFLYFGHGSGSQYIRSKTFKKLDKCAVALLMGCSSGALTEAGEYESYGTPIDYMHAGSPAVLATLWDVTDKDIDRFSQTVLEKWGLFEEPQPDISSSPVKKGSKARGKCKARDAEIAEMERRSLDQAVAEGRDSCIMKYLNGAAPVIYGIPVMLS